MLFRSAALVKVFDEVKAAFKRSDEAGTALAAALAKLQPIVTAVRTVFEGLATVVAKVVSGVTTAATAILRLVPAFREAQDAAVGLVKAQDELQEKQRQYTINEAEREKQMAELRKKAVSDEKLTAEEREKIYQQIDELSRQNMEERVANAKKEYENLKQYAEQENDTSDEMKDRLTEAYAAMIKAQTAYLQETTRIGSRAAQARKEQAKAEVDAENAAAERRKAAHEAWKKKQEERMKALEVESAELRKLEDLQTQMIEGELERQRVATRQNYERQIEDLRKRLETEKNLTVQAREAINEQITLLNEQMWRELAQIDESELTAQKQAIEKMVEETSKAAAEAAKKAAQATQEEQQRIREKYEQTALGLANDFQEKLNAVYGNAAEQAELEAQRTATYYQSLVEMDATTKSALFESEEAYKNAVLQAESEMYAARKASEDAMQKQVEEVGATMQAVTGALSDLFEAAAGDSEAYEKYKKAMAIVDAVISMAQTIAAATSVSTAGDPYTMAIRIAANVAAVTAQFAAVIAAIKKATIPSAPSFEHGGIVPGTSYTGDKVTANVNSREMVLTQKQQAHLFEMIKAGVPQQGIDYDLLAATMAAAVASQPAPVLDYREFTMFTRRVALENNKVKQL